MVTGDITVTYAGQFSVSTTSGSFTLTGANCGAATAGAETGTFMPIVVGNQVYIYKLARAA